MTCFGFNRFPAALPCAYACLILSAFAAGSALAAPPNDHLAGATVLIGDTNFVTGFNAGATSEPGETNHAHAVAGKSVWWTWQAPFTGSVSVSTVGSTFDTLLSVYTGSSFSNLQTVAENDDAGSFGVVASSLVFRAFAGETFRIAVDGFNGATGIVRLAVGHAGYAAPAWSLFDLDGVLVTSSDFPHRVLVIDFWETTCGACVDELPALIALHQNLSAEGLAIFGVSKDIKTSNVKGFVWAHGITYGIAMNHPNMENAFGGNVGLPTKFVIDRENRIVGSYIGGGDYGYYEEILRPLLRGSTRVPLSVQRPGAAFVLAWPATEFGYRLESSDVLGGTNWSVPPFPIVTTNDQNTVTLPIGSGDQFFRLRKTTPDQ